MDQTAQAPKAAEPEPQMAGLLGGSPQSAGWGSLAGGCLLPGLSGHEGHDREVIESVQRTAGNRAAVALLEENGAIGGSSRWARAWGSRMPRAVVAREIASASLGLGLHRSRPAGSGGPPRGQRSVAVQRDAAVIDGSPVATYADLDKWYTERIKRLKGQREDLLAGGLPSPAPVQSAISSGESAQGPLRADPASDLDGIRAIGAQVWFDNDFKKANNAAEAARGSEVSSRLAKLNGAMRKAETSLNKDVLPTLRDKQQKNYRDENDEGLLATADAIATVVDTALVLKDGITEATKTQKELVSIVNVALMNQGHPPPLNVNRWVVRIGSAIETANKAYAGIQLVRAGLDIAASGKTEAAEGRTALKAMATVISAGGTLLGASTGMTVYANLYIGPAVDACITALKKLEEISLKIQRDLLEEGLYDKVDWKLFPGGREMFDFMRAVMRAGSASQIPDPIPATVASYLGDHAEDLATGAKAEEMETTGVLWWKKADPKWAKYWIMRNRESLWGMFYGSLTVPS